MVPAWIPQLTRGVLALALGLLITLTLAHTPLFGLVTFGVFALLAGAALLAGSLGGPYAGRMSAAFVAQGALTVAAGVGALVLSTAGMEAYAVIVGSWALTVGILELVSGIVSRGRSPLARDWVITGALTIALAAVAFLLPPDFTQSFSGDRGVAGVLTAPVVLIGVVGAWAVLVGVLQVISGVSVRGLARRPAATA